MATDYFVYEDYDHGKDNGSKGSICGKEAGTIHVYPKGHPIENFWPTARTFSHKMDGFVAPLSPADITRLGSVDQKILFYVSGVSIPCTGTAVNASPRNILNILFAYQILRDNCPLDLKQHH